MYSILQNNGPGQNNDFWRSLHPATFLIYMIMVITVAVVANHPLILIVTLAAVILGIASTGGFKAWLGSLRIFIWMILIIALVNIIVNPGGATVLLASGNIPLLGRVALTAENLLFSLVMGIRLLVIYSLFILYNKAIDPDRLLALFSRIFPRSAIMAAMAARTMPGIAGRMKRIWETQRARGVNINGGNSIAKVKSRLPLVRVLLHSVLEDSFNMGESIQARAYGSGPRTSYHREAPVRRDYILMAVLAAALGCFVIIFIMGWGMMNFFPVLGYEGLSLAQVFAIFFAGILLSVPALLSWGCNKWDYLRWKI